MITVESMSPIPAGANPFHYDDFNMGTTLVRGWVAMHEGFDRDDDPRPMRYLILVNTRTGERFRLNIEGAQ